MLEDLIALEILFILLITICLVIKYALKIRKKHRRCSDLEAANNQKNLTNINNDIEKYNRDKRASIINQFEANNKNNTKKYKNSSNNNRRLDQKSLENNNNLGELKSEGLLSACRSMQFTTFSNSSPKEEISGHELCENHLIECPENHSFPTSNLLIAEHHENCQNRCNRTAESFRNTKNYNHKSCTNLTHVRSHRKQKWSECTNDSNQSTVKINENENSCQSEKVSNHHHYLTTTFSGTGSNCTNGSNGIWIGKEGRYGPVQAPTPCSRRSVVNLDGFVQRCDKHHLKGMRRGSLGVTMVWGNKGLARQW